MATDLARELIETAKRLKAVEHAIVSAITAVCGPALQKYHISGRTLELILHTEAVLPNFPKDLFSIGFHHVVIRSAEVPVSTDVDEWMHIDTRNGTGKELTPAPVDVRVTSRSHR
jgi:hypothetical protein